MRKTRAGFTLVELMVAVCILSIGLVGIARSLLNAVSALDYCNNLVNKMSFLDNAMCELEKITEAKEGFESQDSDIANFLEEKNNQASQIGIGRLYWTITTQGVNNDITEFEFKLVWKEGDNEKSETLICYLPTLVKKPVVP